MDAHVAGTVAAVCLAALVGFRPGAPALAAPPPADGARSDTGAILAASALPPEIDRPLGHDPISATIDRLDNGLTIYVSPRHDRPEIVTRIVVRAGSRQDPADSTGLAHYLEHMLFKGTDGIGTIDAAREARELQVIARLYRALRTAKDEVERRDILRAIDQANQRAARYAVPNELDQLYGELGVSEVNAYTAQDYTVYLATVPANRFAAWAAIEAERFQRPVFRLFYPELEAVYEEKNELLDDPWNRQAEALDALLYPGHPYGTNSGIGEIEHLKNPAYDDMVAFFHRYYVPNNMAVVIAGDIEAEQAVDILGVAFSGWQPRLLPPAAAREPPTPAGRVVTEILAPGQEGVAIGWRAPAGASPDRDAFEVLATLLSAPSGGLIDRELRASQLLPDADSGAVFMREAGLWTVEASARAGQSVAEVERLLGGVIDKAVAAGPSDGDVAAAKQRWHIDEALALEDNRGRADRMTEAFALGVDWETWSARAQRIASVTTAQVAEVARRYLGGNRAVVRRLRGAHSPSKLPRPAITPVTIDNDRHSARAREIAAMPAEPIAPAWLVEDRDYRVIQTPSGPLYSAQNRDNDVAELRFAFDLGYRSHPLVCLAINAWQSSGVNGRSPAEVAAQLFALGAEIDTWCDADGAYIAVTAPDASLAAATTLLRHWLGAPRFDAATRKRFVDSEFGRRAGDMEEPAFAAVAVAAFAARGQASPYLAAPTNTQVEQATAAGLSRQLHELGKRVSATMYYGSQPAEQIAAIAALAPRNAAVVRPPRRTLRSVARPTAFLIDRDVAQAELRLTFPSPPLPPQQMGLAALYSRFVGGDMGAVIFQEIREARGLAYDARAGFDVGSESDDDSAAYVVIQSQSDKVVEALTTALAVLVPMDVPSERFAAAQRGLDGQYRSERIARRAIPYTVHIWRERGLSGDPREIEWRQLTSATAGDLRAFAARATKSPPVISLMGDLQRIDQSALAGIAEIIRVEMNDLVSYAEDTPRPRLGSGAYPRVYVVR